VATGQQHEDPDQHELASDQQTRRPDVSGCRGVFVRRCVIRGLAHLIGSWLQR
jgi:hypothetical protein